MLRHVLIAGILIITVVAPVKSFAAESIETIKPISAELSALYEKERANFEKEKACLNKSGKKEVLIIGDSISEGYTAAMPCNDGFKVTHNPGNAASTWMGRAWIHSWLSEKRHRDLIVFNFGIHDLHSNGLDNTVTSKPEEYEFNLHWIAKRLKQEKTPLLFVTTTPLPNDPRVDQYNVIANRVMKEEGVPVFDMNAVAKPLDSLRVIKNGTLDTHFLPQGYVVLADSMAKAIRVQLHLTP